jgi:hypothetical protein
LQTIASNKSPGDRLPRVYDRALLLHGSKCNEVLSLADIEQYGTDSFADADYVSVYGMRPRDWYSRCIRLLGRTAVECTRDALGDHIGRDVASVAIRMPANQFVVPPVSIRRNQPESRVQSQKKPQKSDVICVRSV